MDSQIGSILFQVALLVTGLLIRSLIEENLVEELGQRLNEEFNMGAGVAFSRAVDLAQVVCWLANGHVWARSIAVFCITRQLSVNVYLGYLELLWNHWTRGLQQLRVAAKSRSNCGRRPLVPTLLLSSKLPSVLSEPGSQRPGKVSKCQFGNLGPSETSGGTIWKDTEKLVIPVKL